MLHQQTSRHDCLIARKSHRGQCHEVLRYSNECQCGLKDRRKLERLLHQHASLDQPMSVFSMLKTDIVNVDRLYIN